MRYLPHTSDDIASMLQIVGEKSLDDLYRTIPLECRFTKELNLPDPLTEWELNELLEKLSSYMAISHDYRIFMGAGSYNHYIPYVIPYILGRSEFATAYTPYQAEMSQGTLQALYEYQTLTTRLLGMEVANASLYDGASALAEALLMAIRISKKTVVAVSNLIHPNYRKVIQTYFRPTSYKIIEIPHHPNGKTDINQLNEKVDLAAIAVQSPNFFGCIEDLSEISEKAHRINAQFITSFTEPIAYGLLKNPGSLGADIVCGEGQSLGIPQSFGGPNLGMFATKTEHLRNMPGRLVGKTTDTDGKRGFVLTLSTREQHIRRGKATSNICSNSNLNALAAVMYMASLGGMGFHQLAILNHDKSEYLKRELKNAGVIISFESPTFNEFVVKFPSGFEKTYNNLLENKIIAGLPLSRFYPQLTDHYLLCVTETMTKKNMNDFVKKVKS